VTADVLLDLGHQFPRWRHNERADAPRAPGAAHRRELREDRQYKRRRLAGAGLGYADEIMPGEDLRDGGRLDRRGFGISGLLDGFEYIGLEAKGTKWHILINELELKLFCGITKRWETRSWRLAE
jgi:hypothetical protein